MILICADQILHAAASKTSEPWACVQLSAVNGKKSANKKAEDFSLQWAYLYMQPILNQNARFIRRRWLLCSFESSIVLGASQRYREHGGKLVRKCFSICPKALRARCGLHGLSDVPRGPMFHPFSDACLFIWDSSGAASHKWLFISRTSQISRKQNI